MIPILLYSPQPHNANGAPMIDNSAVQERLFVADATALMEGKDLRHAPPILHRLLSQKIGLALKETVGEAALLRSRLVPLVDASPTDTQPDTLRALLVIVPELAHCPTSSLPALQEAVVRRWQLATQTGMACVSEGSTFANNAREIMAFAQIQQRASKVSKYTVMASETVEPGLDAALLPIEKAVEKRALAGPITQPQAPTLLPMILFSEQEYSSANRISLMPMSHTHTWLTDLNAFMHQDMRHATPEMLDALVQSLKDTMWQHMPQSLRVMPLFEPTQEGVDEEDRLRGVMVRINHLPSCDERDLPIQAKKFVDGWQRKTGQECVALSQSPEFAMEAEELAQACLRNVSAPAGGLATRSEGIEINAAFEKTLRNIEPALKTHQLEMGTAPAAGVVSGKPRI